MRDQYFATLDQDEIGEKLKAKITKYYDYLRTSGLMDLYTKSYNAYYKGSLVGGELRSAGEKQQLTTITINHFRNLIQHILVLTTSQRPAWDPKPVNTDHESESQSQLAAGLLEYYLREKRLEPIMRQVMEYALIFGEGFASATWDTTAGAPWGSDPETEAVIKTGDLRYAALSPFDVVRDFTRDTSDGQPWYITRRPENRFDLMAQFPDYADKIERLPGRWDDSQTTWTTTLETAYTEENDDVWVYEFFHERTPAVEDGRYVMMLEADCVPLATPLPYRKVPVYRAAPGEKVKSAHGYTIAFDMLPLQQASDSLHSTVVSNINTFGVQNIMVPEGANLSVEQLKGNLQLISYSGAGQEPKALQLLSTSGEVYSYIGQVERLMETISGVNAVARGNVPDNIKSGTAMALVQSMAIQFNTGFQMAWVWLQEEIGTGTIHLLQDFADKPQIAMIAGKSNKPVMREFTGEDLKLINRVHVEVGSPVSKTLAGRMNLADQLLGAQMLEGPQQYIEVLNTGRVEPLTEGIMRQRLLIKRENEKLAEGVPQTALVTDDHVTHVREHANVLASPEARENPNAPWVQATLAHMQEHMNHLDMGPQNLFAILYPQNAQYAAPPPMGPPGAAPGLPPDVAPAPPAPPQLPQNPLNGGPAPMPGMA